MTHGEVNSITPGKDSLDANPALKERPTDEHG